MLKPLLGRIRIAGFCLHSTDYSSSNSPKPPMKDTDGISRHRLSPHTVYYR